MMIKTILKVAFVSVLGVAGTQVAVAAGSEQGGMNTNTPRANDKLISKEPAYKSMNSNKPAANAGLSGVSGSDLKVEPNPKLISKEPASAEAKLISKEPAYKSMNSNKPAANTGLSGVSGNDLKVKPNPKLISKEPAN